ncbi:MAG: PD-(D/E)XK nuclease family protein [Litorimonas sp.]
MSANVYNMPSGAAFLPSLAAGLRAEFGDELQDGLILLPTRRAVRAMGDAFVLAAQDDKAMAALLPRMRPLADVNPEEPPFEPGELIGKVAPAIDPMQRRFELAQLITRYHERAVDMPLDPATALAMADPLLSIMDDAAMEEVNFAETDAWKQVTTEAAIHFQHAATLYEIIEKYWPQRLAELKLMEAQARKVALLNLLTKTWRDNPPDYPIIIAGSTGTLKATARLMRCVAALPKGRIILPGLQEATDDVWENIDVQHPQYSLKNLLGTIGIERQSVRAWPAIIHKDDTIDLPARRLLLSEALVPVNRTSDWLGRIQVLRQNGGDDIFARAMNGMSLIEAPSDDDEALTIALIMRHTLETDGRSAALITPDQALAGRVKARLTRWNITVDMSQGGLLSETSLGVFLDAVLELCQNPESSLALSVLFTHPLSSLGQSSDTLTTQWQALEVEKYRGIINPDKPPEIDRGNDKIVKELMAAMASLLSLTGADNATQSPSIWAQALIDAAENIAQSDAASGAQNLWRGEAGASAASLLENLITHGQSLPFVDAIGFSRLLQSLMGGVSVRPKFGTHPRLSILGPLEARMLSVDVTILGGLNEGIWPVTPKSGPFLSRGMRKAMKLSLPERRYGLAAHDFAELAANPVVYLTRSKRSGSGPMIASRWVWRLQTLLRGALGEAGTASVLACPTSYLDWAQHLDRPDAVTPATPPAPMPPVDKRWGANNKRGMSITSVQTWIRDPYAIYARYCLGLSKLDGLEAVHGPREFGSAVHKGIETFLEKNMHASFSKSQTAQLTNDFKKAMNYYGFPPEDVAKETARFEILASNFLDWLIARKQDGFDVIGTEVWAKYRFEDLNFNLRGILDLVEQRPDGYSFIDHKTGAPSTVKVVEAGFDPQLPLAAFLAEKGGLKNMKAMPTSALGYLRVKGSNDGFEHRRIAQNDDANLKTAQDLADEAVDVLRKLIEAFDKPNTAYHSQPRAQYANKYGDFDDLARRGEWSGLGQDTQS